MPELWGARFSSFLVCLLIFSSNAELIRIPLHNFPPSLANMPLDNLKYFGSISAGTPSQEFTVVFDVALSYSWLPCSGCRSCLGTQQFSCDRSMTCTNTTEVANSTGGVPSISGAIMEDGICLHAGSTEHCTSSEVAFICVNDAVGYGSEFFDGIIGLSYDSDYEGTLPQVLSSVFEGAGCTKEIFSLWPRFDPEGRFSGGELTLCGVDRTLHEGEIVWKELALPNSWAFLFNGIYVGDAFIEEINVAFVSTAIEFLLGPEDVVKKIWHKLDADDKGHLPQKTCRDPSSLPTITIAFDERFNVSLTPKDYVAHLDSSTCFVAISPTFGSAWFFGAVVMTRLFVVFDRENSQLGFAKPRQFSVDLVDPVDVTNEYLASLAAYSPQGRQENKTLVDAENVKPISYSINYPDVGAYDLEDKTDTEPDRDVDDLFNYLARNITPTVSTGGDSSKNALPSLNSGPSPAVIVQPKSLPPTTVQTRIPTLTTHVLSSLLTTQKPPLRTTRLLLNNVFAEKKASTPGVTTTSTQVSSTLTSTTEFLTTRSATTPVEVNSHTETAPVLSGSLDEETLAQNFDFTQPDELNLSSEQDTTSSVVKQIEKLSATPDPSMSPVTFSLNTFVFILSTYYFLC